MFLKKIQIEKYKCFDLRQEVEFAVPDKKKAGSGLTILIGANNSGKTALVGTLQKFRSDSLIHDEEKFKGGDVVISFFDETGQQQVIKNLPNSANIDTSVKNASFTFDEEHIHFIQDNRIWTSNFGTGDSEVKNYRRWGSSTRRHEIDGSLAQTLSTMEKKEPAMKKDFDTCMREILPSFSGWTIGSSSKAGNHINYTMLNGESQDIDFSLGSGILNLFRMVLGLVDDSRIVVIDEPEAYLHPLAQRKLANLFLKKSKDKQIIITTHSPYMFQAAVSSEANLVIFKRKGKKIDIKDSKVGKWGLFARISPTFGEITYKAYDLPTIEFHNELYGFIQSRFKLNFITATDAFLVKKGDTNRNWILGGKIYSKGLSTYIRNYIHHPEQTENPKSYTQAELKRSIIFLMKTLKK